MNPAYWTDFFNAEEEDYESTGLLGVKTHDAIANMSEADWQRLADKYSSPEWEPWEVSLDTSTGTPYFIREKCLREGVREDLLTSWRWDIVKQECEQHDEFRTYLGTWESICRRLEHPDLDAWVGDIFQSTLEDIAQESGLLIDYDGGDVFAELDREE